MDNESTYIAFAGWKCVANGTLDVVLRQCKAQIDAVAAPAQQLLIFQEKTGNQVDFDFRGSIQDVLDRMTPKPERTGPGRPRLGVVSREISLLPRHWEWLEMQSSGASATLRRLVDEARRRDPAEAQISAAIQATGRLMTALAGNLPGFEEAYRALYARDRTRLVECVKDWPEDVRACILGNPVK
jgi:uncharacterized protein